MPSGKHELGICQKTLAAISHRILYFIYIFPPTCTDYMCSIFMQLSSVRNKKIGPAKARFTPPEFGNFFPQTETINQLFPAHQDGG